MKNNKLAFVLGGNGVIGKEIVKKLSRSGIEIVVLDIKIDKEILNENIHFFKFDVAKIKQVEKKYRLLLSKFKCPNYFINASYPISKEWGKITFENLKSNVLRKNVDLHMNSSAWSSLKMAQVMKKNKTKVGALKHEAVRGSRGLFYHGRAYLAIFSIADTLEQAGISVYDNVFSDAINKSVNFYIDASADNKLIYKWAKKKKNNDGNPKVQEQANTGNSWVGMFINNLGDAYPDTVTKLYKSKTIQKNFFESVDDEDAGFWEGSDSECFYPVYRQGKFQYY